jgi:hypothetical protein
LISLIEFEDLHQGVRTCATREAAKGCGSVSGINSETTLVCAVAKPTVAKIAMQVFKAILKILGSIMREIGWGISKGGS